MSNKEREAIKRAYPKSKEFHKKVDKMPDDQVVAIYKRLQSQGRLGR